MPNQSRVPPNMAPIPMKRRPPWTRSMAGPRNGATTANGAIVSTSDNTTLPRASLGLMLKNSDPARASVTRASPPVDSRWAEASLENGVGPMPVARGAARAGFCSGRQPAVSLTGPWYGGRSVPGRRAAGDEEPGQLLDQSRPGAFQHMAFAGQQYQLLGIAGSGVDVAGAQVGQHAVVLAVDQQHRGAGQPVDQ